MYSEISRSKKRKRKSTKINLTVEKDKDSELHGNWWKVTKIEEITGPVAIELGRHTYIKALDNGMFTLGAPHNDCEGPAPEEILTAVNVNDFKIAFKSGYNKYLRVEKDGTVTGRSDAIGPMEQWEPIFCDGKLALQSNLQTFMGIDDEDTIIAMKKNASDEEFLNIRSQTIRELNPTKDVPVEDQGSLEQIEVNYV